MASLQKVLCCCWFLIAFAAATVEFAFGETHKVGDSEGWTVGNISYTSWTAKRNFHVGDIIVFEYNQQFHNVLQVTRANYRSCNATAPIASFNTGNDSIPIKRKGHYLFICGFPGHCSLGQKVDIRIVDPNATSASPPSSGSAAFSPSSPELPFPPSSSTPAASAPMGLTANHAPRIDKASCLVSLAAVNILALSAFFFS